MSGRSPDAAWSIGRSKGGWHDIYDTNAIVCASAFGAGRARIVVAALAAGKRDTLRLFNAARRDERIAKLELQLGIGLDYGRDWLLSRPLRAKDEYMAKLMHEGNGAVERVCWGCDKPYRPHSDHDHWYRQTPEERELADRLCGICYAGATSGVLGEAILADA